MLLYNIVSNIAHILLCLAVAWIAYRLLQPSAREALDSIIGLPAATVFYTRMLALVLFFVALEQVVDVTALNPDARKPEYIWAVTNRLGHMFQNSYVVLLVFLGLMTVLFAALRRRPAANETQRTPARDEALAGRGR